MSKFTLIKQLLGYDDENSNSNPLLKGIERNPAFYNIPVANPQTIRYDVGPGSTVSVFNGTRSLTIDNTSVFSLTLSPISASTYRLLNTGGTTPGFRTNRSINTSTIALTLSVGANLVLTVTAGTGTPFTGVQVGDAVFIPGLTTGDTAGPFNSLNEGYWYVLTASSTILTLKRNPAQTFSGISEVVTPSTALQFQAFSSDNVQVGDTINIVSGFAASALHQYPITAVNPLWVEFTSTLPLGNQTGISPTATGIIIYTLAKRWIYIETDQEIYYQLNGDTGTFNHISPIIAGCDPGSMKGTFDKWGTVWQLSITNVATNLAHVLICTVE